jgi:hypothetical protein
VPILEGLLARIVAETGSELHDRNNVWTAPARADRMLVVCKKNRPGNTFLNNFGVVLGAKSSHLGVQKAMKFGSLLRSRCRSYGNRPGTAAPQPGPKSSQRSKSI